MREKNACMIIGSWYSEILKTIDFHCDGNVKECVNATTLLGDSLTSINQIYIFYLNENSKMYGFDIRELAILKANPYTGTLITKKINTAMQSRLRKLKKHSWFQDINVDCESNLSMQSKISRLIAFISNKYCEYHVGDMGIDTITIAPIEDVLCYMFIISQNSSICNNNNNYLILTTDIITKQRHLDDDQILAYCIWKVLEYVKLTIEKKDPELQDPRIRMVFLREVWFDVFSR